MEAFVERLAQSSEVVIVLVLGIVGIYRMLIAEQKKNTKLVAAHKKELKEVNASHAKTIEDERNYIRDRDAENLEILTAIKIYMDKKD